MLVSCSMIISLASHLGARNRIFILMTLVPIAKTNFNGLDLFGKC